MISPKLKEFYAHPLVGFTGTIAGIIGIALAIYFYTESLADRHLLIYVHSNRASLVKTGGYSNLSVSFADKRISTDVSAAQITIWNNGKLPIRADDLLEKINLHTEHNSLILQSSIQRKSRDLINFDLDVSNQEKGLLGIAWNILEQNDGATIQIIYAGDINEAFQASGAVVGQRSIPVLVSNFRPNTPEDQHRKDRIICFMLLTMALLTIVLQVLKYRLEKKFDVSLLVLFSIAVIQSYFLFYHGVVLPSFESGD